MSTGEKDSERRQDHAREFKNGGGGNGTGMKTLVKETKHNETDESYDPFEHRDTKDVNSDLGSLAHLVKSSLGSGILAMPNAMKNGGLVVGAFGTVIVGIICAHCVYMLVKSSQMLCKRTKRPMMTFAETTEAAFAHGPMALRKYSKSSKTLVNVAICATHVSGVCVYVVFIAESIKQVADHHTGIDIDKRLYMIALIPAVVVLSQIRDLRHLVPFSILANTFIMTGLGLTLYLIFKGAPPIASVKMFSSVQQLPIFFATVIFAIEGIGVVLPVENRMKRPKHFLGCPGVLSITMTIVIFLYAATGIFGYLRYGEDTASMVTLNLDTKDPLAQVVKLLVAFAILFSYGLQFFVPLEIICRAARKKLNDRYATIGQIAIRFFMALSTVAIALAVPTLQPFIGLMGSVFLSFLGILIPAVVETLSRWESHLGVYNWRLWKNCMIVAFSIFALISGSLVSVEGIIENYTNKDE